MPASNGLIPTPGQGQRMPRSVFRRSVPGGCSMNYGRVYPVYMQYQEAGTSKAFDMKSVIRGATPIAPVMGNAKIEFHAFSVPWRIIFNYTKQFFGENDTSAWTQQNDYQKPQIELRLGQLIVAPMGFNGSTSGITADNCSIFSEISSGTWTVTRDLALVGVLTGKATGFTDAGGTTYYDAAGLGLYVDMATSDFYGPNKLADYLGLHPIPKNAEKALLLKFWNAQVTKGAALKISVDALPFRAFFSVINYYYRDQNYQAPYLFSKDNEVLKLSVIEGEADRLPMPYDFMVYRPSGIVLENPALPFNAKYEGSAFVPPASRLRDPFSTFVPEPLKGEQYDLLSIAGLAPVVAKDGNLHKLGQPLKFGDTSLNVSGGSLVNDVYGYTRFNGDAAVAGDYVGSTNLMADLAAASKITLEKFRDFVVLNQWNEKAVKGTRFAEILNEFYGVPVNPALLDEPRFLGGVSVPIASWQVTQTAPNSDGSGVGDLSAFTHTKDSSSMFVFNFDEPSILLVCAVARVEHTFAQQVDPHWFRKDKFDEHYALFDGLGYQPLDKRIPYLPAGVLSDNGGDIDGDVLGFQESYWEERYQLGNMAGVLNASNHMSLDYWNYNELPTEHPTAGPEYLSAYRDADIVDRTLQLGEQASLYAEQLICDFSFDYTEAKVISSRMDPGLTRI